jgi:hypothetical protein
MLPRLSMAMLALAGCTELVVIGDECRRDACIVELDGRVIEVPLDAGVDSREPDLDANVVPVPDAQPDVILVDRYVPAPDDAAVWMPPDLMNPSFEVTDGQPGDVTAVSLPTGTAIAPWFTCQPIGGGPTALTGVRAEALVAVSDEGLPTVVRPRDGLTFIAMQYFVTLFAPALLQQLATPLHTGTLYGFAIDVRTSNPDANLSLQVFGASAPCLSTEDATLLTATAPITRPGWQTVCLRFNAPSELPFLMLVESAESPLSGDRLFFDNLRSVEACPP